MPRILFTWCVTLLLSSGWSAVELRAQTTARLAPGRATSSARLGVSVPPIRLVPRDAEPAVSSAQGRYGAPLELPPAGQNSAGSDRDEGRPRESTTGKLASVVFSSLAIVLGLFFLVVWLARRALPRSATSLPSDVLELLGRSPLAGRHHLQLIRLGHRLLLVSVTAEGAKTLSEITDVDEVNHLVSLCRQHQPGSITGSFRQALEQLSTSPSSRTRQGRTGGLVSHEASVLTATRDALGHMREVT